MDTTCLVKGKSMTTTLIYEISTIWEMKPRTTPQKTSQLLKGAEQVVRPKTLQPI